MNTKEKGDIGEEISCRFLVSRGFCIEDRNYRKKWGEIDIVAKKSSELHFFEVKSVSGRWDGHRPEDNVHRDKIRRLRRTIQTYMAENRIAGEGGGEAAFHFHVISVFMDMKSRRAKVRWLEDVVI